MLRERVLPSHKVLQFQTHYYTGLPYSQNMKNEIFNKDQINSTTINALFTNQMIIIFFTFFCHLPHEAIFGEIFKSGVPNDNFWKNICSEDDLRSRIFGTFVVKFLAYLPLLGFSDI